MRQAIVTTYLGPTRAKGPRIKATADAGSVTVAWDHALGGDENHRVAALALAERLGWQRYTWVGGTLPGRAAYAFVAQE